MLREAVIAFGLIEQRPTLRDQIIEQRRIEALLRGAGLARLKVAGLISAGLAACMQRAPSRPGGGGNRNGPPIWSNEARRVNQREK